LNQTLHFFFSKNNLKAQDIHILDLGYLGHQNCYRHTNRIMLLAMSLHKWSVQNGPPRDGTGTSSTQLMSLKGVRKSFVPLVKNTYSVHVLAALSRVI